MTRLARSIHLVAVCALTTAGLACSGGSTPTTPSAPSPSAPAAVSRATIKVVSSSATGYLEPTGGVTYIFDYQVQETGGTTGALLTRFDPLPSSGRFLQVPVLSYIVPAGRSTTQLSSSFTEGMATRVLPSLDLRLTFTDDGGVVSVVTTSIPVTVIPRWTVYGVVRTLSGTPASGLRVSISYDTNHGSSTITDGNGYYSVANVAQGTAHIGVGVVDAPFSVLKDVLIAGDTRVDIQINR